MNISFSDSFGDYESYKCMIVTFTANYENEKYIKHHETVTLHDESF